LEQRRRVAVWVASNVIPHEAAVRGWLARSRVKAEDIEELIQDAYCRLATLDRVDHIERANAYFFSTVRNLLMRRLKRERIVSIEAIAEIDSYIDLQPTPEEQAASRLDFARLIAFLDTLPERCATIVRLRKIEGWSQKEIAAELGITEKAVEKQVWLGVKAIQAEWRRADSEADQRFRSFEQGQRA
jgi:RNA polymerase sigma factor (sigma-70 family)